MKVNKEGLLNSPFCLPERLFIKSLMDFNEKKIDFKNLLVIIFFNKNPAFRKYYTNIYKIKNSIFSHCKAKLFLEKPIFC